MALEVKFKKLVPEAVTPSKAHPTDAGFDLTATSRVFDEDGNATYGFGLAVEIPAGYMGLIFPRSSIAVRDLALSNSIGVIDSSYRGEIKAKFKPTLLFIDRDIAPAHVDIDEDGVAHFKDSDQTDIRTQQVSFHGRDGNYPDVQEGCSPFPPRVYRVGERIAQLVIMPYPEVKFVESWELSDSDRGTGGYGSTGK